MSASTPPFPYTPLRHKQGKFYILRILLLFVGLAEIPPIALQPSRPFVFYPSSWFLHSSPDARQHERPL
jgi:hypothetical protein